MDYHDHHIPSELSLKVQNFLSSNEHFLLISGEKNSGKTKLTQRIFYLIKHQRKIIHISSNPNLRPRQFIKLLTQTYSCLDINPSLKLNESLQKIIAMIENQQRSYLLIIDHAHLLPFSMLAALRHMSLLAHDKKIKIVLLGRPHLAKKMHRLLTCKINEIQLSPYHPTKMTLMINYLFSYFKIGKHLSS